MYPFNRVAIQTKLVSTKKHEDIPEKTLLEYIGITPFEINQIAKNVILYSTIAITGTVLLLKAADTASQIAVKKTASK